MIKLQSIGLVALAMVSAGCFAPHAQAQTTPENIADAITTALFNQSGDLYRNRGIDRQASFLFGLSYPEHEFINDSQAVEKIYRQGMQAQSGGKVIRTTDLPNPFTSSILTTPPQVKSSSKIEAKSADTEIPPSAELDTPTANPIAEIAPRGRG